MDREVLKSVFVQYFNPRDQNHVNAINFIVSNPVEAMRIIKPIINEIVDYQAKVKPEAVTLAGTPSIPATLASFILGDIKYVVTSREVVNKVGIFRDSGVFLENLTKHFNFEVVVVDFTNPPIGLDAQKLLKVLRDVKCLVLQASGFISDFIVLNAGCTRIVRPYPINGKLVFFDITKLLMV